jgi:alpha-amylase/alpha-mannosidase (GH57 family)
MKNQMNKFICIHGHFYQPPRENPWLEEIEVQDSAYPYRDWNERISAECYNPNTASRILDSTHTIIDIINNYGSISFNFGPTLLSWMEIHAPDAYKEILKADKESLSLYSGHGSAIAQVYNHMILPLANRRDKRTQAIWGIEDFKYRFQREPEGMWLAETAVDTETLEVLAELGIKFTILAPRQAARIKKKKDKNWLDVSGGRIDPRRAYLCNLPSGKSINLFFYDGIIAQDLAFGDLLKSGEQFANRLLGGFDNNNSEPQLVNIATDGESYGHHHAHGDMALAYSLYHIKANKLSDITVYGEFLERFPPEYEVEIIENTSWSCIHGVERWKEDCGCNSGKPGWNQKWRAPLRNSFDWLRDSIIPVYEIEAGLYTKDVWEMRDEYIKVILNREQQNINNFFSEFGIGNLNNEDRVKLLKLLEMQRFSMLMYTSCGWFFDEISGIETTQVIQYAARAVQLLKEITGNDLENQFIKLLEKVPGNIPGIPDGAKVYEAFVKPAKVDLYRVTAHYGISSLFEEEAEKNEIFCYEVKNNYTEFYKGGKEKMVIGKVTLRSKITYEERVFNFAFLHLGDHNLNGGVNDALNDETFSQMREELKAAFEKLNIVEIIVLIDRHFGSYNYTIWHLFKDKFISIINKILTKTLEDMEHSYRRIYENNYAIMNTLKESRRSLPKAIVNAVEFTLNSDIKNILQNPKPIDADRLGNLFNEASKWSVELDKKILS